MRVIDASKTGILVLGYQGESQRVMVRLPLVDERNGRNVAEEFPGGQFSLSVTFPNRPGEFIVSPSDYQVDGDWLEWVVKEAYTQFFGEGNLQINYSGFDSTGMTKSRVWRITNKKSISTGAGTVPDWSDWKTELLTAAAAVQNAVDSYDEMSAEAEELPAGSTPTAEMDHTGDHPVLKLGIPASQGGGGGDVQSVNGKTGAVVLNANDVGALPADTPIPPAVTVDSALSGTSTNPVQNKVIKAKLDEQSETIGNLSTTVSGKYAKPSGGIPSTDMSQAVQTSLGKADTALQAHQDISGKQNKPSVAGTAGQVLGLDGSLNPVWKTQYPQSYELIVDITLAEDTDDLVITRDSNDDEISVTELFVECDFEAAGATNYLLATWRNTSGSWKDFPTGQMLSEDAQTCFYWLQRRGNIVQAYATRPYWWDATSSNANYYYNRVEESETIRGINLYKYSSSAQSIPAGSRIRIWGVRA